MIKCVSDTRPCFTIALSLVCGVELAWNLSSRLLCVAMSLLVTLNPLSKTAQGPAVLFPAIFLRGLERFARMKQIVGSIADSSAAL